MERDCCIRGYHVHVDVWDAPIHKMLDFEDEPINANEQPLYSGGCKKRHGHWPFAEEATAHLFAIHMTRWCDKVLCSRENILK